MTIGIPSAASLVAVAVIDGAAKFDAPVEPDAEEARRLLLDELSKPQYAAAQPTLFDQIAQAVWEWITSLSFTGTPIEAGLLVLLFGVAAAIVVAAFVIFGRPRLSRRSAVTGPLFGVDERRTADELRASARAAASQADWSTAIEEQFRAIARSLGERTILTPSPGTTAQSFASQATAAFPEHAKALRAAAVSFDDVRYLEHAGSETDFERIVELDRALERTAPILLRRLGGARA